MNRKYSKNTVLSFQKAISFKTATVIVVALHLVGFLGITQWSAYKTKLLREKRQEEHAKQMELIETEKFNWPEGKTRIVATSPIPKPAIVKHTSSISPLDKVISFFSFNAGLSTTNHSFVVEGDYPKDEMYNKKAAEIAKLIDHATALLSQKAKELATLEASLKEKQKQLNDRPKEQNTVVIKTESSHQQTVSRTTRIHTNEKHSTAPSKPVSSTVSAKTSKPKTTASYSTPATSSSPIVISPDTVKTYTKNGMQYIDVVDTSKILSSHIVLQ